MVRRAALGLVLASTQAWHAEAGAQVAFDAPGGDLMFGADYEAMKKTLEPSLKIVQQHVRAVRKAKEGNDGEATMTFHDWLWKDLDPSTQQAMKAIQDGLVPLLGTHRSRLAQPLVTMDELYVSAVTHTEGSDKVFITPHMDGFFQWLPLAAVKRCIYGVDVRSDGKIDVATIRPYHPVPSQQKVIVGTGDVVCFDYNHDIHWITQTVPENRSSTNSSEGTGVVRVVLKFHYVEVPKGLSDFGPVAAELNSRYNVFARSLFVTSLDPDSSALAKYVGHFINLITNLSYVEYYTGLFSMIRVLMLLFVCGFRPSLLMPSLGVAHYFTYIFTFLFRSMPLEVFIRDAMFLKSSAMTVLALTYFQHSISFLSILVAAAGFALSAAAFKALGHESTYFGWQYGRDVKPVEEWPYGTHFGFAIPHPMILGSAIGLVGLLINAGFRRSYGRCILAHLVLYGVVLALEITDVHVPQALSYGTLAAEFETFHKNPGNIWAHLFTTALGFFGVMATIRWVAVKAGWNAGSTVCGVVFICLLFVSAAVYYNDPDVATLTGLTFILLGFSTCMFRPSLLVSLLTIVIGFGLQEVAHMFYQEPAYMWSYFDGSAAAVSKLVLHTVFLIPFNFRLMLAPELKVLQAPERMAAAGLSVAIGLALTSATLFGGSTAAPKVAPPKAGKKAKKA